jgi:hypothetical protein
MAQSRGAPSAFDAARRQGQSVAYLFDLEHTLVRRPGHIFEQLVNMFRSVVHIYCRITLSHMFRRRGIVRKSDDHHTHIIIYPEDGPRSVRNITGTYARFMTAFLAVKGLSELIIVDIGIVRWNCLRMSVYMICRDQRNRPKLIPCILIFNQNREVSENAESVFLCCTENKT